MSTPHKCPCCDGFGRRQEAYTVGTAINWINCLSCGGTGIVWSPPAMKRQPVRCGVCGEIWIGQSHTCVVRQEASSTEDPQR